eukprot:3537004-Pleurochrysis_carterae.AAC.2
MTLPRSHLLSAPSVPASPRAGQGHRKGHAGAARAAAARWYLRRHPDAMPKAVAAGARPQGHCTAAHGACVCHSFNGDVLNASILS